MIPFGRLDNLKTAAEVAKLATDIWYTLTSRKHEDDKKDKRIAALEAEVAQLKAQIQRKAKR